MAIWPVAPAIAMAYAVQGSIDGFGSISLPQLLQRGNTGLEASERLAIVKLPFALKILFAPFVDVLSQKLQGYKRVVLALQALAAASLFYLHGLLKDMEGKGGLAGAGQAGAEVLRWPLFATAAFNALGDLALDSFALSQFPGDKGHLPALCQVTGVYSGKVLARSGLFELLREGWLSAAGFVFVLVVVTMCSSALVLLAGDMPQNPRQQAQPQAAVEERREASMAVVLQQSWHFTTQRPNMLHWLGYQLVMPAIYVHSVTVMPSRYEQMGFGGEDYAAYDLLFAAGNLMLLVWFSGQAANEAEPLTFFLKMYWLQILLVVASLAQYLLWSGSTSTTFTLLFVVLNKVQDFLFFIFETGEFAFYGRVAKTLPGIETTLLALQASAFNFADFFHSWLAPTLVDAASTCKQDQGKLLCDLDAYPLVAAGLTAMGALYMVTQWNRIIAYQDLRELRWQAMDASWGSKGAAGALLLGIGLFTAKQVLG